jgi:hypothetical protein
MKNLSLNSLSLSSGATLLGLIVPMALISAACTDTKARFTDFENAAFDAGVVDALPDAPARDLPDPTGTYYVTFVTQGVEPDEATVVNLLWSFTAVKDANNQPVSVTMVTQTLTTIPNGRVKIGTPITKPDLPVSPGGEIEVTFNDFLLEGMANFSQMNIILDMKMSITLKTADAFCGIVTEGMVQGAQPLPLAGSSFVGVRVEPDTVGDALPAPINACPNFDTPDAGVPDGGTPDAGAHDADLPDAT